MLEKGKILILTASAALIMYIVVGGFLGKLVARDNTYEKLSIFNDVLNKVQSDYVEVPDIKKLTVGALKGLANEVDFYSCYLTKKEYEFIKSKQGASAEIGVVLSPKIGYYRIMEVFPSSPAEKAGVIEGDVLEEINGNGISEKPYPVVKAMLSGDPGDIVKLGIQRGRDEALTEIPVTMNIIKPVDVTSRIIEKGIGYLKIRQTNNQTVSLVKKGIRTLLNSEAKKIIIDLRDCCDRSSESAIKIANLFIDNGILSIEKGQTIGLKKFPATTKSTIFRGPLVVLINGYTAGGAEIIASAIKDNKRGKVVGLKTYGTASIQRFISLSNEDALFLTEVKFLSPKGKFLMNKKYNKSGVKPDIKSPPEDFALSLYIDYEMSTGKESQKYYKRYMDAVYKKQLEKALEILETTNKHLHKAA